MKTELERAIEKLEDIEDWDEDSSVNIMIHNEPPPKSSSAPMPVRMLKLLTPWGRVVVIVSFLIAAVATGVAGQILLKMFGVTK